MTCLRTVKRPKSVEVERTKLHKSWKIKESVFCPEESERAQYAFEEIILEWLFTIVFLYVRLYRSVTRK